MLRKNLLLICFLLTLIVPVSAKIQPGIPDGATLQLLMKRLNVVGGALYIAAHPDDENTAVLSDLAMGYLVRTAYLALNRGEGGQNLIGPETGDLLGLIRTQELLAARNIDYAGQFFTRAVDFGYSKSPEESLRIWGKDEVLSDVVWVIRKFRPDVIILRFTSDPGGHGHHTASAILGEEAFHAAADPNRFPDQLRYVTPWKAKRVVWNRYNWRGQPVTEEEKTTHAKLDVGTYNPLLGKSYSELAGVSRSMHKSQGFGDSEDRGSFINYFKHLAGEQAHDDLFEGVDLTWNRISNGNALAQKLSEVSKQFKPADPSSSIPGLLEAYALMKKMPSHPDVEEKKNELSQVIRFCAGLWLEAIAEDSSAIPGGTIRITTSAINRSAFPFSLEDVRLDRSISVKRPLETNLVLSQPFDLVVPKDASYTQAYWLQEKSGKAMAGVNDQQLIGRADSPPAFNAVFRIGTRGETLEYSIPVLFRWVDPVVGERYRLFQITPEVTIQVRQPVAIFTSNEPQNISMTLRAGASGVEGTLRMKVPPGWKYKPESVPFRFEKKGETRDYAFQVSAESTESGIAVAQANVAEKNISNASVTVDYPHISPQTVFPQTQTKLIWLDLKRTGDSIGYIVGSGDQVPETLQQIGYRISRLSDEQLKSQDLSVYDTIVVGIRAYNTRNVLRSAHASLLKYVDQGGTLVVQYNTLQDLVTESLGPFPFRIGRDRVSVEEAPVTITDGEHPLLNTPNKITAKDFEGWIQERGLYFADQWDSNYQTPLASADPGESAKAGGLLYAKYGKGIFIYTSYSWFRQLPAGVPGAIRIFVNLVSARSSQ